MQWYEPVIQLNLFAPRWLCLLRLGLSFWLVLLVISISGKIHAFSFGLLRGGEYIHQSELVTGAVYARSIIKGENDAPILVEYDLTGKEVNVIGEQYGKFADTQIMSSAEFNGYLYQREKIEIDYKNQFKLLKREDYERANFWDQNGDPVFKKTLLPDTLYVWVLKQEFITPDSNNILLEIPIYAYAYPVSTHPSNYIRSVLIRKKTGQAIYRTENNIGYRTGFIVNPGTGEERTFRRKFDDELLNPLPYTKVFAAAGSEFTSTTDELGKYRIEYFNPACPGFEITYHNPIIAELHYSRFHPRKTEYLPYFLIREKESHCNGLAVYDYRVNEVLALQSIFYYHIDFPVDMMVLRGSGSLYSQDEVPILVGDVLSVYGVYYDFDWRPDRKIMPTYDLNNDGRDDWVVPGKLVKSLNSDKKIFIRVDHLDDAEVLGIFFRYNQTGPPDLIRQVDWYEDFSHKGMVTQVNEEVIQNTDLYVVRTSTGELVAEQKGLTSGALAKGEKDSHFQFLVRLRGRLGEIFRPNRNFERWQVQDGVKPRFRLRNYDHIRPGEQVTLYLINRVTGYMGHKTVTLGKNYGQAGDSDLSTVVGEVKMYPPNLKIWAVRRPTRKASNQLKQDQMIGAEGSGLTADKFVAVFTEWLDHNDQPLPPVLADYGYTGRLARVTAPNQLTPATNSCTDKLCSQANMAHFSIQPGRHTQLIHFSEKVMSRQHFYVQVSAVPKYRNPTFASKRSSVGLTSERFVPIKVPIFDEVAARAAKVTEPAELQHYYHWVYRPELQFSLYDLNVQSLQILNVNEGQETIRDVLVNPSLIQPGDKLLTWFYSLIAPELETLKSWSKPGELVLAIGDQEVSVTFDKKQKVTIDNLEKVRQLDADGLLTLRLYANNDSQNILWQYNFPGPFLQVPEVVKGRIKLDIPNERVCVTPARLQFNLQQPAKITLTTRDRFSGTTSSETKLLDEVLYPAGTHLYEFDPAAYPNGLFTYQMTGVSEISHKKEQYSGVLEVFYDIDNQLPVGHVVERNIDLFTGNLAFSRTDIDIPGRGGGLQFTRSYNSQSRDAGRLGRGWSHNYDVALYRTGCGYVSVKGMVFIEEGDRYRAGKGYHGTLKKVGNRYDLYTKDGTRYHFRQYAFDQSNRSWHLAYIEDTNGNQTQLSYHDGSGDGRLKSVVDSAGRRLDFF
ncbi:hypothetical protein KCM76_13170, partial [Zooshikella marina]